VGGTKNPDVDAIVRMRPDVVVLDEQENRREDATALHDAGLRIFVSDVRDVAGAVTVVGDLAELAGVPIPSTSPVRVPDDGSAGASGGMSARPAFVPIWRRPWMTIGVRTYGASVLGALGWHPVGAAGDDADYPTVDLESVANEGVEAVLVPSEPYDFDERHLAELREALPSVPVTRIDGRDLFWWGVRTPGALDRLGARLARVAH
jgi:hypothetical protein